MELQKGQTTPTTPANMTPVAPANTTPATPVTATESPAKRSIEDQQRPNKRQDMNFQASI
jgi:acyl-CoA hydrolase